MSKTSRSKKEEKLSSPLFSHLQLTIAQKPIIIASKFLSKLCYHLISSLTLVVVQDFCLRLQGAIHVQETTQTFAVLLK